MARRQRASSIGGIYLVDTYISGGVRRYSYFRNINESGTHVYTKTSRYAKKFDSFTEAERFKKQHRLKLLVMAKGKR